MKNCPEFCTDTILYPDALPQKGGLMRIWHEDIQGTRWYYVDRAYVRGDGKSTHYRRKTDDPVVHARQVIEAQSITGECSLTSKRFSECVETYLEEKGAGGFSAACYDRAVRELGRLFPDKNSFAAGYAQYAARLEAGDLAINTANNYKIVVRSVCNYAHKTKRCGAPAVTDYQILEGNERSRILSPAEQLTIENKLREWDSHLIWAFDFALKNPIRKRDLFNLKRADLKRAVVDGRLICTVQFVAQKTSGGKRKTKITTLPNVSREFLDYEAQLPSDCPWLFPMVGTDRNGRITKLHAGAWKKIIEPDRHFARLIDKCGIHDFTFHDLKHCAETYMLRQGYHYDDMRKLGIQMSSKTQKLYDNRSQVEIVARVLSDSILIASEKQANE
jgi:integrase